MNDWKNLSSEILAGDIRRHLRNGADITDVQISALEQGIPEELWNDAIMLLELESTLEASGVAKPKGARGIFGGILFLLLLCFVGLYVAVFFHFEGATIKNVLKKDPVSFLQNWSNKSFLIEIPAVVKPSETSEQISTDKKILDTIEKPIIEKQETETLEQSKRRIESSFYSNISFVFHENAISDIKFSGTTYKKSLWADIFNKKQVWKVLKNGDTFSSEISLEPGQKTVSLTIDTQESVSEFVSGFKTFTLPNGKSIASFSSDSQKSTGVFIVPKTRRRPSRSS